MEQVIYLIRDDNYKIFKNKNRKERLAWFHEQAKEANIKLAQRDEFSQMCL